MKALSGRQLEVSVQVRGRQDGGITVTSIDVPGLLLSGSDGPQVWSLVGPSLARLLQQNHGYRVERMLYATSYPAGLGPHDVAVHVEHFVALLAA